MEASGDRGARVRDHFLAFRRKVLLFTTGIVTCGVTILCLLLGVVGEEGALALGAAPLAGLAATSFGLGWVGRVRAGAMVFIIAALAFVTLTFMVIPEYPDLRPSAFVAFGFLAAFLISPRWALITIATTLPAYVVGVVRLYQGGAIGPSALPNVIATGLHVVLVNSLAYLFSNRLTLLNAQLGARVERDGELFSRLPSASAELGSAARQLAQTTREHGVGAQRQSAAIREARQALESVTRAAGDIVDRAANTSRNADTTLSTTAEVAARVERLAAQAKTISELLDTVGDVADKTDLLALNASLEGVRAGEAGRGFQLVSTQMQRLAERVKRAVLDIEALTAEIHEDAASILSAMNENLALARATNDDARDIHRTIRQLQTAVTQMGETMNEIVEVTSLVATGSEQSARSTADLEQLALALDEVVNEYAAALDDPAEEATESSTPR